ncbi:GNAT family N-acetyltransferase [Pseudomonas sp. R5(2019)]|uniref:GNAT family N-acetyltransferase n=1 Tax=Pseudomonas sp. R5(2019) TaxID=2697566 RepID=UPI0014130EC8|nr:GNAT family N-acetyltransferase [Pseudomonas sp. R5(2019)]NBA96322.1 GNAT family N-acetyltransferase [Pseudomonas sp. R5(2019)]
MTELRLEWRDSLQAADFPAADYERLRERCVQATPFNALPWLVGAERALDADQRLQVLLGWEAGQLRLCLPLVASRQRVGRLNVKVVHHLGFPLSDRIALLAELDEAAAQQVLKAIRRHVPHALLQFNEVPGGAADGLLAQWARRSSTVERRVACRVPVHRLSEADHQEVSGDARYKLRRAYKRIAACGARIRRLTPGASEMLPLLQAIQAVEAQSWKGDEGVGIFSGRQRQQWMQDALVGLAAEGRVKVVMLELDGHCISYRLGLFERGRVYDYNLAFLPRYADLGSGRVLLQEWIRWGLDDGWDWVDASRVRLENSSHQLHERMTGQIEHYRSRFYSWRLSGVCLGLALRAWQQLKPRLQHWRAKSAARAHAPATTTATAQEGQDAVPSHSQR